VEAFKDSMSSLWVATKKIKSIQGAAKLAMAKKIKMGLATGMEFIRAVNRHTSKRGR
jgi:hypothetical protein